MKKKFTASLQTHLHENLVFPFQILITLCHYYSVPVSYDTGSCIKHAILRILCEVKHTFS